MKLFAALIALALNATPAHAQSYQPPRTPDGRPDLQGVWISRWLTPLERPASAKALPIAPQDIEALAKAEWARHDAIDPIEGTDSFEFSTFVVIRGEMRSSVIVNPPDGRLPLVAGPGGRPGSRMHTGLDGPEARALNERCLSPGNGAAPHLTAPSGNIRRIVQTRDNVVIHTELLSHLRIIPVDGRTNFGARHERESGHWEGDTLVVETTGFVDPMRGVRGSLVPVTPKTKIIEHFTRTAPDEILYVFTVEDPKIYTQIWTGETIMRRTGEPMFEFACHEGNYGLANILSGARAVEQRTAKASSKSKPK
ncbi:MAG: hypothetical protein Q8R02_22910 [Hyphomonadaceae bacterium]|nr:hypothetical protein [Hyphomonadaceae bacterium]